MKSKEPFYLERSCLGTRVLELDGCWLVSSGRWGNRSAKTRIDLRTADPQLLQIRARLYRPIVISVIVGAAPIIFTFTIGSRFLEGSGAYHIFNDIWFPEFSLVWGAVALWQICRFWPKVDLVRLSTKDSAPLFDVIKDRKNPEDFETFVQALEERIASTQIHDARAPAL